MPDAEVYMGPVTTGLHTHTPTGVHNPPATSRALLGVRAFPSGPIIFPEGIGLIEIHSLDAVGVNPGSVRAPKPMFGWDLTAVLRVFPIRGGWGPRG